MMDEEMVNFAFTRKVGKVVTEVTSATNCFQYCTIVRTSKTGSRESFFLFF